MKKLVTLTLALLMLALVAQSQVSDRIPAGSKVFINEMDGFETYLTAALQKKEVPLVSVARKEDADFEIKGTHTEKKAGAAKIIFGSGRAEEDASIQVINLKSGVVAYAASSHKHDAWHGEKSTAEAVAKSIRAKIENDAKGKK
jgi:hypothetical protein